MVRLPITQNAKKDTTPPGNIFYATLCEARMAGMIDSSESFKFELVRDFGDYTLTQVADNVQTAQHRLHYQLQPEVCEHRDEATLQRCSSGHQGQPCSQLEIDEASKRSLKCENCHHRHRVINCYEDLNTLPCILILVSKGRLGDTFPDSFFAMDLRLTTEGKKSVQLSTIMQELGRLCRYTDKPSGPTATDEYLKLPYALIGPGLNSYLMRALETFPNFSGRFSVDGNLDMHMPSKKKTNKDAASKQDQAKGDAVNTSSATNLTDNAITELDDQTTITLQNQVTSNLPEHFTANQPKLAKSEVQNLSAKSSKSSKPQTDKDIKVKHKFRILLEAEPQIGKTGVYLKTISILRKAIEGNALPPSVQYDKYPGTVSEEEDAEEEERIERSAKEQRLEPLRLTDDGAEKWRYPLWKTMRTDEFKRPGCGKYDRTRGSKHMQSNKEAKPNTKKSASQTKQTPFIEPSNTYKAYSKEDPEHLSCSKCRQDVGNVTLTELIDNREIKMSVPTTRSYSSFLQLLGYDNAHVTESTPMTMFTQMDEGSSAHVDLVNTRTLLTWIFTPSFKRCRDAAVNYRHTMVQVTEDNRKKKCYYQHFLVVREQEFSAYCSNWDRTHVIIQLPYDMEGIDNSINVESGGIGYARLFIQRFARHYHQSHIFMIDDNIPKVQELNAMVKPADGKEYVMRKGSSLDMKPSPLFKVLKHMEELFVQCGSNCRLNLHDLEYEPHPEEEPGTIQSYTGPEQQYAVMGMLIERKGILRVKKPFKKTHVYAMVLINLQALEDAKIEYEPVTSQEDIKLNEACVGQNLWVCKYNRFMMTKLHLRSSIVRTVYTWPDNVTMALSAGRRATGSEGINIKKAPDSLHYLYHYIRVERTPGRVEIYPKGKMGRREVKDLHKSFLKHKPGDCHLLLFVGKMWTDLRNYFTSTKDIGGFEEHLILIPELFFKENLLVRKSHYENLVKTLFSEIKSFDVCTSHDVVSFKVPYVLLYIQGTSKCYDVDIINTNLCYMIGNFKLLFLCAFIFYMRWAPRLYAFIFDDIFMKLVV